MAKFDLSTIGVNGGSRAFRVAASATIFSVGEPLNSLSALTTGEANANTVVVLTDGKPVIGTDSFVGIASKDTEVDSSNVVIAHTTFAHIPIPHITRIRGRAKSAAAIDTDSELLNILWDAVLFDFTGTTYTIDQAATANTSGLIIQDGDTVKGTLDVVVDGRVMRNDVA